MSRRWHPGWMAMLVWLGLLLPTGFALAAAPPPQAFAADFVQTRTQPGFSQPLVSHGRLSVNPQKGFTWEITKPYHYVFTMDGDHAHEVLPDGTRRALDSSNAPWLAAVEHIFVAALSGDRTELARYFHVQASARADGNGQHVVLTPRAGAMAKVIARIEVTEGSSGRPRSLQVFDQSGATMDVRFSPPSTASH